MKNFSILLMLLLGSAVALHGCLGADDDDDSGTPADDDDSGAPAGDDDTSGDDDDSATPAGDDDTAGDDDSDDSGNPGTDTLECPANDSYEANDSGATAHDLGQLPLGTTTVEGILCPSALATGVEDLDWFSYSSALTSPCYDLTVSSNASQGIDVDRTNAAGNSQAQGTTSPSADVEMTDVGRPTSSHKVGLSRAGNTTVLARRYTLEITMRELTSCQ